MVEPTHLKNISQIGSCPQVGVKIKNAWNHHLVWYMFTFFFAGPPQAIAVITAAFRRNLGCCRNMGMLSIQIELLVFVASVSMYGILLWLELVLNNANYSIITRNKMPQFKRTCSCYRVLERKNGWWHHYHHHHHHRRRRRRHHHHHHRSTTGAHVNWWIQQDQHGVNPVSLAALIPPPKITG